MVECVMRDVDNAIKCNKQYKNTLLEFSSIDKNVSYKTVDHEFFYGCHHISYLATEII